MIAYKSYIIALLKHLRFHFSRYR